MRENTLLVDPLAAFFKPALKGRTPLLLDTTHVEVTLLPPLAHIVAVRRFTNASDRLVEAVLTLPPIAPQTARWPGPHRCRHPGAKPRGRL